MNSFREELTEEVFGHLCNVALIKCNDRNERRKAGCGGHAMRKRVLIKNFVSELFKLQKVAESDEAREEGEVLCQEEEEEEEEYESDSSLTDEDLESFENLSNKDYSRCSDRLWLSSGDPQVDGTTSSGHYSELNLLEGTIRDGAESRADDLTTSVGSSGNAINDNRVGCSSSQMSSPTLLSSVASPSSISLYDIYSGVSETATEGDLPLPNDPLASLSSLMEPSDDMSSCDPAFTSLYESYEISSDDLLTSCFSDIPAPPPSRDILGESTNIMGQQQPSGDELYLSTSTAMSSTMAAVSYDAKGFVTCPANILEDSLEFTDLDAATDEHNSNTEAARKRRSNENYDDFNLSFQKRIKL